MVNYNQDCNGRFSDSLFSKLQDEQYEQNNPELRNFEKEAYLHGNMIFRDWEDNYKNKSNKTITIIRNPNKMNENQLRNIISKMISEIAEESKKEKEQRATPEVKDSAKKYLKFKRSTIAEVEDTNSISLNEWKRQELFGLLSNKFIGRNLSETSHTEEDEEEPEKTEEEKANLKKAKAYAKASGGSDVKTDSKGKIVSKTKPFESAENLKKAQSYAKASGGSDVRTDSEGNIVPKPKPFKSNK